MRRPGLRSRPAPLTREGGMAVTPMLSEERRSIMVELLQAEGAVTITDLPARFGVSPMTARRDLAILTDRGVARRTHDGAVLPSIAVAESSLAHRLRDAPEAKLRFWQPQRA